jgi:hypothetical protein
MRVVIALLEIMIDTSILYREPTNISKHLLSPFRIL